MTTGGAAQWAVVGAVVPLMVAVIVLLKRVRRALRPPQAIANEDPWSPDDAAGSELRRPTGGDRAVEFTTVLPVDHDRAAQPLSPDTVDAVGGEESPGERVGQARGTVTGTAFVNYLKYGSAVITGPVTARALGPIGRGTVALVSIYDGLTTIVFSFGIPGAAGYYASKRRYSREALMGSVVRFSLLLLPVVAITAFGIVVGPLAKFGTPVRVAAVILVMLSPVSAVGLTGRMFLLVDQDLAFLRINDLLPILINAAIVIPFGVLGVLTVPLAVTAVILGNLMAVIWCYLQAGVRPKGRAPYKPLMSYGMKGFLASIANFANNSLDQALVAPLVGVKALGLYSVAVTVSTFPLGLASAFGYRTFGSVTRADGAGAISEGEGQLRMTLLTAAVFCLTLAAAAPLIPLVYGHNFRQAVPPELILLPGTVGLAVTLTASFCSAALGVPQYATAGAVVGLVITVPGLAVAIPLMGINGAALVSTVAYTARAGVNLALLRRVGVRRILPGRSDVVTLTRTLRSKMRAVRRRAAKRRK